jgi:hypothetical protein
MWPYYMHVTQPHGNCLVHHSTLCHTVQLKTMHSPKIALSFGNVLYHDLEKTAMPVAERYPGASVGTMTPALRFPDPRVPESMRYAISDAVLEHDAKVTRTELDVMAAAKEEQAKKRRKLAAS